MKIRNLAIAAALSGLAAIAIPSMSSYAADMMGAQVAANPSINVPQYTADGKVIQPKNWRRWVYVGTPVTPNALNNGKAAFPEFHNVYVEPSAFDHYSKTGKWPNGTQIAKELVSVRKGGVSHKDGSSSEVSGRGYFQGTFQGLELAVKDTKRFSKEPGGWVYFSFGHKKPPYAKTASAFPAEKCNACHQAAAAEDWVFTQFYPVIRAAKP